MSARLLLLLALGLAAAACQQPTTSTTANLAGAQAIVLVDQPAEGLMAARSANPDGGPWNVTGVPARYLFMTASTTNELRVLENFRSGLTGRGFVRGPNPLETLSVPVLDRPTILVTDEARNVDGQRVTGPYVYAGRPGASEVSVVSVALKRQLGGHPYPTPAPVTDLAAWIDLDTAQLATETPVPATTRLFISTWDGALAGVWTAVLPTDSRELPSLEFKRALTVDGVPVVALAAIPPRADRTLDGAPFCAARGCVAVALRRDGGRAGEVLLLDPETGKTAPLNFGAAVKKLVHSERLPRLFGILDEEACGAPSCGGVLGVDLLTGTSAGGFPRSRDATGSPMAPMRSAGIITGLALASNVLLNQTTEVASADGGTSTGIQYLLQEYDELGAYGSTDGVVTFFSGLASSVIDFDGRRAIVSAALLRQPGQLADGGASFTGEDGGTIGSSVLGAVSLRGSLSETWRTAEVTTPIDAAGDHWRLELSDGYWQSQDVLVITSGQLPGLVGLPTSPAAGTLLAVPAGLEGRVDVGDRVRFDIGDDTTGYTECGRTTVTATRSAALEVAEIPAGCEARSRFSVRAAGARPLVVAGDVEGYMGRWAPGETVTYNRPYVLLTAGVTGQRVALTLKIPSQVPAAEGAYVAFTITSHLLPYRVGLDAATVGCYTGSASQTVFGPLAMALTPNSVSNSALVNFRTTLFAAVPSGNGVLEIPPSLIQRVGALNGNDGAYCWR